MSSISEPRRGRPAEAPTKILKILMENPLTWKEISGRTKIPGSTVSQALKRLAHEGFVEPTVANTKLVWALTPSGQYTLLAKLSAQRLLDQRQTAQWKEWQESRGFSLKIFELKKDAWWQLVKDTADMMKVKKSIDESKLRELVDQTKPIATSMLPFLVHSCYVSIGQIIAALVVFRHFVPSPPEERDIQRQDELIVSLTDGVMNALGGTVKGTLKETFKYLEALAAYSDALNDGKIQPLDMPMSFSEFIKKLVELKIITAEPRPTK